MGNQLKNVPFIMLGNFKGDLPPVYFYDMENMFYEVNVHTLEFKLLFKDPIPGYHGKGGFTWVVLQLWLALNVTAAVLIILTANGVLR